MSPVRTCGSLCCLLFCRLASCTLPGASLRGASLHGTKQALALDGDQFVTKSVTHVEHRRPHYARLKAKYKGPDVETVWQMPHSDSVRGIMFFAHSCNHQATDLFTDIGFDGWNFTGCSQSYYAKYKGSPDNGCLGLPEERKFVAAVRKRGYVILATSTHQGAKNCWDLDRDPSRVADAVDHVIKVEGLPEGTPVMAVGATSAGAFVSALDQSDFLKDRLTCIVPQTVVGPMQYHNQDLHRHYTKTPTLFVGFSKDFRRIKAVKAHMEVLAQRGVRTKHMLVDPISVEEAMKRHYTEEQTASVVDALKAANFLDERGFLKKDPHTSHWQEHLKGKVPQNESLVDDESSLGEVLNVAYAFDEFTAQYSDEIMDFCEA